jgi:hypothetical protein
MFDLARLVSADITSGALIPRTTLIGCKACYLAQSLGVPGQIYSRIFEITLKAALVGNDNLLGSW